MLLTILSFCAVMFVARIVTKFSESSPTSRAEKVEQALFNANKLAESKWYFKGIVIMPDGIVASFHSVNLVNSQREGIEILFHPGHRSIQSVQTLKSLEIVSFRVCPARTEMSIEFGDYLQIVRC